VYLQGKADLTVAIPKFYFPADPIGRGNQTEDQLKEVQETDSAQEGRSSTEKNSEEGNDSTLTKIVQA
jgi:hypothetical protein